MELELEDNAKLAHEVASKLLHKIEHSLRDGVSHSPDDLAKLAEALHLTTVAKDINKKDITGALFKKLQDAHNRNK